jgi:hypothetical protein
MNVSPRRWIRCSMLFAAATVLAAAHGAAGAEELGPPFKQVLPEAPLRTTDLKAELPGPGFEDLWASFAHEATSRAADRAPMFGEQALFVRFSAMTGAPRLIFGDLGMAPAADLGVDRARGWIAEHAELLGVDPSQLTIARAFDGPNRPRHFFFAQSVAGLPVFQSELAVHMDRSGRVWAVNNTTVPVAIDDALPLITAEEATAAALAELETERDPGLAADDPAPELGVWPTSAGGTLAWRVLVSTREPAGAWEVLVDARAGGILEPAINRMMTVDGIGQVFQPSPLVSSGINNLTDASVIPEGDYYAAVLPGLDASGTLIGPACRIHASHPNIVTRPTFDFSDLRRTNVQFDQEQVYWGIDFGERIYQALGYSAASGTPLMNYAINYYAHGSPTWGDQDNSSFSGNNMSGTGTGLLQFGTGGVDDAQDTEIVWHEWGHATFWNAKPGINQNVSSEGLGEGFGDYLAGSLSRRSLGNPSYGVTVGEWDAVSYNPGNPPFLRRLDTATFWENRPSAVHSAGQVWSHPLFDFDNQVGPDVGLDVALQALFLMDLSPTQVEGAAAMLAADQLLWSGATAGLITNAFEERHTIAGTVVPVVHTLGTAGPDSGDFLLRRSATPGCADFTVNFGATSGVVPIAGDWNGNGSDTVGTYDPATGSFSLRNSNTPGSADLSFAFGGVAASLVPLAGDWDGNGTDTIGVYDSTSGTFSLKNTNAAGGADITFAFGVGGAPVPLSGDWNGDGVDTIGLYTAATGLFELRNSNTPGAAEVTFGFGSAGVGGRPIAGDWNADGTDTIGVYVPANGRFELRNANSAGAAHHTVFYGGANRTPLAGDWNGPMHGELAGSTGTLPFVDSFEGGGFLCWSSRLD